MLSCWTDRGVQNIKDVPARLDAFKKTARACGAEVREVYMALGHYDTISLVQAPDDEAAAKLALALCSAGNVRTETVRLFAEAELRKLVTTLP
jgi:uncharacterized protein with GYD domain